MSIYALLYMLLAGSAGVARKGPLSVMTGYGILVQPDALASLMGIFCEQWRKVK